MLLADKLEMFLFALVVRGLQMVLAGVCQPVGEEVDKIKTQLAATFVLLEIIHKENMFFCRNFTKLSENERMIIR